MAQVIRVQSLTHPGIALFRDVTDADLRGAHGLCLVEGVRIVRRFLDWAAGPGAGARPSPERLLLTPSCAESLAGSLARHPDLPCFVGDEALVNQIAGYRLHRGALALAQRGADPLPSALPSPPQLQTILAAEGVVHVDNLGSLFRNAGAFGSCGILLDSDCSDPLLRKTIRISAGRVFTVPWARAARWPDTLRELAQRGWRLIAAENSPSAIALGQLPPGGPTVVVLGREGAGLSPQTMDLCHAVVRIPMADPDVRINADDRPSLNVAVASAVFLHELRRSGA